MNQLREAAGAALFQHLLIRHLHLIHMVRVEDLLWEEAVHPMVGDLRMKMRRPEDQGAEVDAGLLPVLLQQRLEPGDGAAGHRPRRQPVPNRRFVADLKVRIVSEVDARVDWIAETPQNIRSTSMRFDFRRCGFDAND